MLVHRNPVYGLGTLIVQSVTGEHQISSLFGRGQENDCKRLNRTHVGYYTFVSLALRLISYIRVKLRFDNFGIVGFWIQEVHQQDVSQRAGALVPAVFDAEARAG